MVALKQNKEVETMAETMNTPEEIDNHIPLGLNLVQIEAIAREADEQLQRFYRKHFPARTPPHISPGLAGVVLRAYEMELAARSTVPA